MFGSYGWGDCSWMRDWEERLKRAGAAIVGGEGITVLEEPDTITIDKCAAAGKGLAGLI